MTSSQHTFKLWSLTLLGLTFLLNATIFGHPENKVLFIGNSYTFGSGGTQSVPDIFDALAIAGGQEDPTTVMRAVGGKDYKFHYENSLDFIEQEQWTHVVLQNYSTQPTHVKDLGKHLKYGEHLYEAIIANNPQTQVMLYMTWARAAAHPLISGESTQKTFATTDEMLNELHTNYQMLAELLNEGHPEQKPVLVNPVGIAWERAGGNLPASDPGFIGLFGQDNHHGNDLGYYLSACVHYSAIYGQAPTGLFEKPEVQALKLKITPAEALHLEAIAWETTSAELALVGSRK